MKLPCTHIHKKGYVIVASVHLYIQYMNGTVNVALPFQTVAVDFLSNL